VLSGQIVGDVATLTEELRQTNISNARGGIAAAVIAAVDVALWDLRSQMEGVPLWKLLWGKQARRAEPYATVYTGPCAYEVALERMVAAVDMALSEGYSAVKVEPLEECVPARRIAEFVFEARRRIGADRELLVDVYHRLRRPSDVWALARELERARPRLLETPLPLDDIEGYAELRGLPIPVAGCELYERPRDFETMLRYGYLDVVQPSPARLGVSAALEVFETAGAMGAEVMLSGWNATPLGRALNVHVAAGLESDPGMEERPDSLYPMIELSPAGHGEDPCGLAALPTRPGLGVDIGWEVPRAPEEPVG
jgi:L-alanine-DL-glutamate epimerase-like enolase superfamily enzyme